MIERFFGERLRAVGDEQGIVTVSHVSGEALLWRSPPAQQHQGVITVLSWSPDGRSLASGGADGTIRLWEGATGRLVQIYLEHTAAICALAWSPDGQRIVSSASGEAPHLWTPTLSLHETRSW